MEFLVYQAYIPQKVPNNEETTPLFCLNPFPYYLINITIFPLLKALPNSNQWRAKEVIVLKLKLSSLLLTMPRHNYTMSWPLSLLAWDSVLMPMT